MVLRGPDPGQTNLHRDFRYQGGGATSSHPKPLCGRCWKQTHTGEKKKKRTKERRTNKLTFIQRDGLGGGGKKRKSRV